VRLSPPSLVKRLQRSLDPVYLLHGAEPLLVEEALDAVRDAARGGGFTERLRLTVDSGFDWNHLREAGRTMSLFAERRLIELRMPGGRPPESGADALIEIATSGAPDVVLAVVCGKLERAQQNTKWFKAIDSVGVTMEGQPVPPERLAGWIGARVVAEGGSCSSEAARRLAYFVEGNLLAAAQEIRKLTLLAAGRRIEDTDIESWVADHARFSVFALVDAALAGNAARALRILAGLRREGGEPVMVNWALTREARTLERVAGRMASGKGLENAMRGEGIWASRQAAVAAALGRLSRTGQWQELLARLAAADRLAKGRPLTVEPGGIWDALERIVLGICGIKPVSNQALSNQAESLLTSRSGG
jgi:DNA polymerase-3 subunit delta